MLDLSNQKWEFNKEEKRALEWLVENGFDVVLKKQFLTKIVLEVSKNGVSDIFHIPKGITNIKEYMALENKKFQLKCKLEGKG